MAKGKPKKKAGTMPDGPLDRLVGGGEAKAPARKRRSVQPEKPQEPPSPRVPFQVRLPLALVERLRDAAYWTPGVSLNGLCEGALRRDLARLEDERGGPFPTREGELSRGRG